MKFLLYTILALLIFQIGQIYLLSNKLTQPFAVGGGDFIPIVTLQDQIIQDRIAAKAPRPEKQYQVVKTKIIDKVKKYQAERTLDINDAFMWSDIADKEIKTCKKITMTNVTAENLVDKINEQIEKCK